MTGFFMSQFTYIISFGCAKKIANVQISYVSRHGWFDVCFAKFCASEILQSGFLLDSWPKKSSDKRADRREIYVST